MSLKWAAVAIGIAAVGIGAYGILYKLANPPRIVSVGNVEIENHEGQRIRLVTRTVASGSILASEVELPNGTWIDCSADCAAAARKATVDFWNEQRKSKR